MKLTRNFLMTAAAVAVPLVAVARDKRPNIILIMTDQHRFDYLGAVDTTIITPALDALCGDGYRFANGYSTAPSSTPARAGLLTGLAPWHHGLLGYSGKTRTSYRYEMPRMLTAAGYHGAAVGKMHWTPQRNLFGLDELYVDESGRVESPGFVSDYRQWFKRVAPGLNPDSLGIGWNDNSAGVYPLADTLHPTWWTASKAIEVIQKRPKDKPLFLKVSFARPHSPYDPPKRYLDMYADRDIKAPLRAEWDSTYRKIRTTNVEAAFGEFGDEYAVNSRRHYAASVTFIDEQVGRVIEELKREGLYENSVILFVSDHGDMLGDFSHWRKTYAYEGSTHVPYIAKMPRSFRGGLKRGSVVEEVVELRDVLPTFLEAAGVEVPGGMDGASLFGALRGDQWRGYVDLEHSSSYGNSAWVGLVGEGWKYVWNYSVGREQLFCLADDPGELRDLSGDVRFGAELEKWRGRMVEHLRERGDRWVRDGELQVLPSVLKSPAFEL